LPYTKRWQQARKNQTPITIMHIIEIHPYKKVNQDEIGEMINEISKEFKFSIYNGRKSTGLSLDKYWVAFYKTEIVGTIGVLKIDSNTSILKNMFVKKGYRGKDYGISQLLLTKVFDWSIKQSASSIYLGTMNQFKAAHKFYEKNGFQKIIKSKLPLNFIQNPIDDIFYKKHLTP
jgi:GNAT superfamily N-acetyltransferase